jgi:hypothetical protein
MVAGDGVMSSATVTSDLPPAVLIARQFSLGRAADGPMNAQGQDMRHAYTTVISGGDRYAPGVEALGRSLTQSGSVVPRLVLCTPDVSPAARARLTEQGWQVRPIEPVPSPDERQALFARFARSFTKLRAFELDDVDKLGPPRCRHRGPAQRGRSLRSAGDRRGGPTSSCPIASTPA